MSTDELPDPPDAPSIERGISIARYQVIGLALLAMLPLLALAGSFGDRWDSRNAAAGSLDVSLRYPTVFRYKTINSFAVHVTNRGTTALDTVTVALDTTYASGFSTVTAVPPFSGSFEVDLVDLPPGQTKLVRIEIQGERYWRHAGELTASSGPDTVRVPVSTFVFP